MKKFFCRLFFLLACSFITTSFVFAENEQNINEEPVTEAPQVQNKIPAEDQVSEESSADEQPSESVDESSDVDDLFGDATDTGAVVTEPSPVEQQAAVPEKNRGIVLNGNLSTRLGGYVYYPLDMYPGALFESTISFSCRPTDNFSIKGSMLVSFPKMELGIYELYFNYTIWDIAFIMAGKKEVTWGNGRIFDTNILDDENNYEYDPEKLLYDKPIDINKSKFTVSVDIPVWHFNFKGLVFYDNYNDETWAVTPRKLSYAAMIEANIWNFSMDVFFRSWADADIYRYDPAVGADLNFQLGDLHAYLQYFVHINNKIEKVAFPRMKGTASVWWATRDKINLGFVLEYQVVYDWYGYGDWGGPKYNEQSEYLKQYLAFEAVWGRIADSKFTLAVKYFHDFYEQYGTVIPGLKIHD
ncbi:hypothetical protein, partial [Treponema sp.]|uniref:hypothetical protein n=1 Tax=Treponema sp. TaxID=166 RepID=UPI00298E3B6B